MTEEERAQAVIREMGHKKEIRGGFDYIIMEFENDYVMKAYGELRREDDLSGVYFLVYKSSMDEWQPPHEDAIVNKTIINAIIQEVLNSCSEKTVKIRFS